MESKIPNREDKIQRILEDYYENRAEYQDLTDTLVEKYFNNLDDESLKTWFPESDEDNQEEANNERTNQ
jgi:hypothetical protein